MTKVNLEIISTEIIDNAVNDGYGNFKISEVSILVELRYLDNIYHLDFQTTTTNDYGAYSSSLAPYDGTDSFDDLKNCFDDEDDFYSFVDIIKSESKVQKKWKNYVDEKYNVNDDHFNGMDGNSEINEATLK